MRDNRAMRWRQRRVTSGPNVRPRDRAEPLIAPPRRAAARAPRFFTVHLGFEAADPAVARELAVAYAEALGLLRPELALGAAALSPADAWHRAEPLFCGALGPDGERCADVAGHPGFHHAPGPGGLGWGDGD